MFVTHLKLLPLAHTPHIRLIVEEFMTRLPRLCLQFNLNGRFRHCFCRHSCTRLEKK
jgi:hypothetical protein